MKLAGQKRGAIIRAEALPWRCHRSLIADALTVREIRVDDIVSMKRFQIHPLLPFGRAQGHDIMYPVGDRGGGRVELQGGSSVVGQMVSARSRPFETSSERSQLEMD